VVVSVWDDDCWRGWLVLVCCDGETIRRRMCWLCLRVKRLGQDIADLAFWLGAATAHAHGFGQYNVVICT
jgi:hypothetical protein